MEKKEVSLVHVILFFFNKQKRPALRDGCFSQIPRFSRPARSETIARVGGKGLNRGTKEKARAIKLLVQGRREEIKGERGGAAPSRTRAGQSPPAWRPLAGHTRRQQRGHFPRWWLGSLLSHLESGVPPPTQSRQRPGNGLPLTQRLPPPGQKEAGPGGSPGRSRGGHSRPAPFLGLSQPVLET